MRLRFDQLGKQIGRQALGSSGTTVAHDEISPERAVADQILLNLRHALGKKPNRTPAEQEFVMTMHKTWEDARREGRDEGRSEEAARAVLTVLRVRGLSVPDAVRERILAEKDPARLERWHERAIVAASIAEVIGEPS